MVIEGIGYCTALLGAILALIGLYRIGGELAWHAAWRWASARQILRNVRHGWNAGPPPENQWVLVANKAAFYRDKSWDDGCWAVMIRDGDTMYTRGGGLTMPIKNVEGWLVLVGDHHD